VIDPAALKRLASAVRFRPWPPQVFKDLRPVLRSRTASADSKWSPDSANTRMARDHCCHRCHQSHSVRISPACRSWGSVRLLPDTPWFRS